MLRDRRRKRSRDHPTEYGLTSDDAGTAQLIERGILVANDVGAAIDHGSRDR
jgi:hypothetical protein